MDLGNGHTDVVDPEVRAYIYSLVTAVSPPIPTQLGSMLTRPSLEEMAPTRMADTCWETTP